MTVRFFIHSIAKRAEAIALLDSGATENFMNLSYAKWLKLPIKQLPKPRKLFNVDGTENRSGDLRYYTILNVRTGSTTVPLQFFLSDLGEHKAILGYPWFAAMQPKIDWKRGWIDHTHLPIIFRSPDAKKAEFLPRNINRPRPIRNDRYFIGRVTLHSPKDEDNHPKIPRRYRRHKKVFSEKQSQRLPAHSIWDHAIELLPGAPRTLPGRLLQISSLSKRKMESSVRSKTTDQSTGGRRKIVMCPHSYPKPLTALLVAPSSLSSTYDGGITTFALKTATNGRRHFSLQKASSNPQSCSSD